MMILHPAAVAEVVNNLHVAVVVVNKRKVEIEVQVSEAVEQIEMDVKSAAKII